jgi:hypothetical protein
MGSGRQTARPVAAAVRRFRYSEPDPWSWIPGTWIEPGAVFATKDGRFYRFATRLDDGWDCDEVPASDVGGPQDIARIVETRRRYDERLAVRDKLAAGMLERGDTVEARSLIREHNEELHRLRDQLILLCNKRTPLVRDAVTDPDKSKWGLVIVLAIVFVLALVFGIVSLFRAAPESAGRWVGQAAVGVLVLAGAGYGLVQLIRHKNRLLQNAVAGSLLGCIMLILLLVLGVGFVIVLFLAGKAF